MISKFNLTQYAYIHINKFVRAYTPMYIYIYIYKKQERKTRCENNFR